MIQRHGWVLLFHGCIVLFHGCIVEQLQKLQAAAARAERNDPMDFKRHANVKLFRALTHHPSVSSRGGEAGQGASKFSEPQEFSQSPLKPGETRTGELAKDPVVRIGLFRRLLFQRRR